MLKVWGRRNAFNVQKAMWLVGELGLAHELIDAGGSFGGLDRPDFLAMNPHGRVPVIDDDGTIVWESHAIIRYLSARYGLYAAVLGQRDQSAVRQRRSAVRVPTNSWTNTFKRTDTLRAIV